MSDAGSERSALSALFDAGTSVSFRLDAEVYDTTGLVTPHIDHLPGGGARVVSETIDAVHGVKSAPSLTLVVEAPEAVASWGPFDDVNDAIAAATRPRMQEFDEEVIPPELVTGECARVVRSGLRDWKRFCRMFSQVCRARLFSCLAGLPIDDEQDELDRVHAAWNSTIEATSPHQEAVLEEAAGAAAAVKEMLRECDTKVSGVARTALLAARQRRSVIERYRRESAAIDYDSARAVAAECRSLLHTAEVRAKEGRRALDALSQEQGELRQQWKQLDAELLQKFKPPLCRLQALIERHYEQSQPVWFVKWIKTAAMASATSTRQLLDATESLLSRVSAELEQGALEPDQEPDSFASLSALDALGASVAAVLAQLEVTFTDGVSWTSASGVEAAANVQRLRGALVKELLELVEGQGAKWDSLQPKTINTWIRAVVARIKSCSRHLCQVETQLAKVAGDLAGKIAARRIQHARDAAASLDKTLAALLRMDKKRHAGLSGLVSQEADLRQAYLCALDTLTDVQRGPEGTPIPVDAIRAASDHDDLGDALQHVNRLASHAATLLVDRKTIA